MSSTVAVRQEDADREGNRRMYIESLRHPQAFPQRSLRLPGSRAFRDIRVHGTLLCCLTFDIDSDELELTMYDAPTQQSATKKVPIMGVYVLCVPNGTPEAVADRQ